MTCEAAHFLVAYMSGLPLEEYGREHLGYPLKTRPTGMHKYLDLTVHTGMLYLTRYWYACFTELQVTSDGYVQMPRPHSRYWYEKYAVYFLRVSRV